MYTTYRPNRGARFLITPAAPPAAGTQVKARSSEDRLEPIVRKLLRSGLL